MIWLYKIVNNVTGDVYIGQTSDKVRRFSKHRCTLRDGTHCNRFLQRSYHKYGPEAFRYELIVEADSTDNANRLEIELIEQLRKSLTVYNLRTGGKNGTLSEETKRRIGDANRGKKRTSETRRLLALAVLGKRQSSETIAKRVQSRKGYKHSEETKALIASQLKGKKKSFEHIQAMKRTKNAKS